MQRFVKDDSKPGSLVTIKDTAWELTVSVRTAWRLIAAGELRTVRIGRAVRITRDSIQSFIERGGSR
jgi:excisionase family DNA binding protein